MGSLFSKIERVRECPVIVLNVAPVQPVPVVSTVVVYICERYDLSRRRNKN